MGEVGEMESVPTKEVWGNETDFTQWLAKNLDQLGQPLGLELQLKGTEVRIPPHNKFSVDILATETKSGARVVIENQITETDHSHLGQLITYAAGCDARILIWVIVAPTTEEWYDNHRIAVEWLNRWTFNGLEVYAVAAQPVKVGQSQPVVEFLPVVYKRASLKRLKRQKG